MKFLEIFGRTVHNDKSRSFSLPIENIVYIEETNHRGYRSIITMSNGDKIISTNETERVKRMIKELE